MDLVSIFLDEKQEKILEQGGCQLCTSFIPTIFLPRGQLLFEESKVIDVQTVELKDLRINLKLGVSALLLIGQRSSISLLVQ